MTKSRISLIGAMAFSCAAMMSVSQAFAADVIVASDPEPVSYVQVCDGAGDGFFYIPGSQTCLKFSGDVRTRATLAKGSKTHSTRSAFGLVASSETEFGPLVSSAKYLFDVTGSNNVSSLDYATISLNGFETGFHDSAWTRFSMSGFDGASLGGYTGAQDAHFMEYGASYDLAKFVIGAESIDGNLTNVNPYAGVEIEFGNIIKAFGLVVYDSAEKSAATRIGAKATIDRFGLGAWASFDNGKTSYVTGSGNYDFGLHANAAVNEKLSVMVGYSDSDNHWSDSHVVFGATYKPVDGLTFSPEIQTNLKGNQSTTGRFTLLRSF